MSSALESYFEQAAATYVAAVSSHLDDDPPTALWQAMAIAQTARDMTAVIRAWVRTNLADPPDRVVDTYFTLAPPWQLARADETGRITLRRGRGHRDLPPRALDLVAVEAAPSVNQKTEEKGAAFVAKASFDDEAAQRDLLARILFAVLESLCLSHALQPRQLLVDPLEARVPGTKGSPTSVRVRSSSSRLSLHCSRAETSPPHP